MAVPTPARTPYVQEFGDYLFDPVTAPNAHVIRISVAFNEATRIISSATLFRAADCLYTKIYLGRGADGSPDTSTKVFNLAGFSGTRTVTGADMAKPPYNITTIEDFLAVGQITAGP